MRAGATHLFSAGEAGDAFSPGAGFDAWRVGEYFPAISAADALALPAAGPRNRDHADLWPMVEVGIMARGDAGGTAGGLEQFGTGDGVCAGDFCGAYAVLHFAD